MIRGEQILGERKEKRKRGPQPPPPEGGGGDTGGGGGGGASEGTESNAGSTTKLVEPAQKRSRWSYDEMSGEELAEELRRRKMKPGRLSNEKMRELLNKEDRCQSKIVWTRGDLGHNDNVNQPRGGSEGEGEGGRTQETHREAEEDAWEDIDQGEEDKSTGSETVGEAKPRTSVRGRSTNVISPGRPRGKGRRGYWVAKREAQMGGGHSKSGQTKTPLFLGRETQTSGLKPERTAPETAKGATPADPRSTQLKQM